VASRDEIEEAEERLDVLGAVAALPRGQRELVPGRRLSTLTALGE
jgi:hypothetical protein